MKDKKHKLILLLDNLSKFDLGDFYYSLTINYVNIVRGFDNKKFNIDSIKDKINNIDTPVTSYNLSLNNYGRYDEKRYEKYYHNVDLVFYYGGIAFNFTSRYLTNSDIRISNINKLFTVYEEHKKSSKVLYDVITKNNKKNKK